MNILQVLSQYEVNGAETYAATLANEQIKNGHTVVIVSDTFRTRTQAQVIFQPIGKRDYLQRINNIQVLRKIIREKKIDVVHTHSRASSWVSFFATRFEKKPLVSSIHMQQHIHTSTKLFSVYGDKLIAVCPSIYLHLQKELGYSENRLALIYNGIDLNRWQFRKRTTVKRENKIVAFVGRFTGFKGDSLLIILENIFPEVYKRYNNVRFHLVGGMSDKDRVFNMVENVNRRAGINLIHIKGFTQHVEEIYYDADVILGSGRVAMEALACGNLVVSIGESNDVGIISEKTQKEAMTTNFGDLDVRRPFNIEKCIDALVTALRRPDIVSSEWGRVFIEINYNIKSVAVQIDKLYEDVIARKNFN